jgi:hypothetical protein
MRRRKLLVALAVVVGAGVVVLFPWQYRVSQQNMNLIRPGMTWADVKAIFGAPDAVVDGPHVVSQSWDLHLGG